MGRASLPLGAWGTINTKKNEAIGKWRASCRFRDHEGVTRTHHKFGTSKGKAENALLTAMRNRQENGRQLTENPTLAEVAKRWLTSIEVPEV